MKKTRCAIYTRKSSEDGLEQEFNSLDAQREACAAFIASQKAEGWVLLPETYDDGGLSGGTMERPALLRLLADIDAGRVDRIVVYKIDRLTRSLADFAKIVDRLDLVGASFVSVTQAFNTATSMGRLTLNMLLSFAQFEREVTAERIRDKIAASKRKGLWMGGQEPLGYVADGRTLKIRKSEAETVRTLYRLYEETGTIRGVKAEADALGLRSRRRVLSSGRVTGGIPFDRGHIHHILTNPIYAGRIRHRNEIHDGQHPAIIEPEVWERVQARLCGNAARTRQGGGRGGEKPCVSRLAGKLYDETGDRLTPSHTKTRDGKRLRYYVSHRLIRKSGEGDTSGWRLPTPPLEAAVARLIRERLDDPRFVAELLPDTGTDTIRSVSAKIGSIGSAGDHLALVERIDVAPGEMVLALNANALAAALTIDRDELRSDRLIISTPFQHRKRGVETKLILGNNPAYEVDQSLLKNVANAHDWFDQLKAGKSYADIARTAGTSKRRVQQMIDLAFLAPDIVRMITEGRQPLGLTSDWLLRHDLSSDWDAQRDAISRL